MAPSVAVVGGGVNGVGAALAIQDSMPSVKVTVLAAELTPDTTGDGSAGVWSPRYVDGDHDQINRWGRQTHDFLHQLWRQGDCPGIGIVAAYDVADSLPMPHWACVPFSCVPMSERALQEAGHEGKEGFQFVTIYAMPSKMLPFLMGRFTRRGGRVVQTKVNSLDDLNGYDVIVNCAGLGARDLVGDERVTPVRGQVIKVTAPAVKGVKFNLPSTYVIPNDELLVLGGTAQKGDWRLADDPADVRRIMAQTRDLIPSLAHAGVHSVWAGLRPFRQGGVRLEAEWRSVAGRMVPVVHNYGHGGAGVTLFWGCALDVAHIVKNQLGRTHVRSKL